MAMWRRGVRGSAIAACLVLLGGCSSSVGVARPFVPTEPAAISTPAVLEPTLGAPTDPVAPPAASAGPEQTPPPAVVAVPMAAGPSTETFTITPAIAGGATGNVTVTRASRTVRYHIVVTGVAPNSTHAIHDHLGSCAQAGVSQHLMTLDVATAGRGGDLVVDLAVPSFDAGAGRILLVYTSASPTVISGCAQL